jgi:hypothetical protein
MEYTGISGIHVLLKIQENRDHLVSIQEGKLFFRKLSEFAKMPADTAGRADRLEGSTHVLGDGPHKIKIESKNGEIIEAEIDDVRVGRSDTDNWYCFCLYAVNPGEFHDKEIKSFKQYRNHLSIKPKTHGLGRHLIYFTDTQKFFDQILEKMKADKIVAKIASVKYVDVEKYSGTRIKEDEIGLIKPSKFSHQNEYRILVKNPPWTEGTYSYDVGDLRHITKITTVEDFNSSIEIGFPDDFTMYDKAKFYLKAFWYDLFH